MAIALSNFENGPELAGDYGEALAAVQRRLAKVQVAYVAQRRRAIVMVEGWDCGGKGETLQRLVAGWDARHFTVWPIGAPTVEERARHFLWRFWSKLPADGEIGVFDRSWYGRVLVERVEGLASEKEWRRAYDEINEFEAQQRDSGTTLVKLFLHISEDEQDRRMRARLADPWTAWKVSAGDFRSREKRPAYVEAMEGMFRDTDTRWAPWKVIDGNNAPFAHIAALTHVADTLEKAVSMTPPPIAADVAALAKVHFGPDWSEDGSSPEGRPHTPLFDTARGERASRDGDEPGSSPYEPLSA